MRLPLFMRNILFDFSGTLFDDFKVSLVSTRATILHFGGPAITLKDYREHFTLPVWQLYRRYRLKAPITEINRFYFDHFTAHIARGKLFPGSFQTLKAAKKRGLRLFIFSTVRQSILEKICGRLHIASFFTEIKGDILDKDKALKKFLRTHRLKPKETLFVGDTTHDIIAAKKNGLLAGAMLCGYQPPHRLLEQAPDFVWNDHHGLLKFLNSPSPPLRLPHKEGLLTLRGGWGALLPIPTVGSLIFNRGDIFLVQTHKWGHTFGIPGGKIQKGETMQEALKREIWEETSMKIKNIRWAMVQDSINSKEFYRAGRHFLLLNFYADSLGRRFTLNEESESGFWVSPQTALKLRLNQPTRTLLAQLAQLRGSDRDKTAV